MTNTTEGAGHADVLMAAIMTIAARVTPLPWWRAVLVALLMAVGMSFIGLTFAVMVIVWKVAQTGCTCWVWLMGGPPQPRQHLAGAGGVS